MAELEEKLQQIKTALAELRTTSASGPTSRKQLDSLFRQVHTLKAVAAADGLTDLSRAAHELENTLHSLRTGEASLNDEVLHRLSETFAALSTSLSIPDELFSALKTEAKQALKQSLEEGADVFLIQTTFNPADFDQKFQDLKTRLDRDGEVISIMPQLENERLNFKILFATQISNLQQVLAQTPNVKVEQLLPKPAGNKWDRIIRAGESTAKTLGKEIDFEVSGMEILLDDEIADCLIHLVRNAVHHGIQSRGTITIRATTNHGQLTIKVSDNGRGIDPEAIATGILFQRGFSTASDVSEVSGRGVGLDVVKTTIEARGGSVTIESEPDQGSTFVLTLP